jgi:hypothetical protein
LKSITVYDRRAIQRQIDATDDDRQQTAGGRGIARGGMSDE